MNLYIDVGNTATKFAIDEKKLVTLVATFDTGLLIKDIETNLSEFDFEKVEKVFISSVVPQASKKLEAFFLKYFDIKVSFITSNDNSGVSIEIDNREELGADLLCDLAAAKYLFGNPCLIIDLGTATKFLFINMKNIFYTCAIIQGLEMSLHNLSKDTALLPMLDFEEVKPLLENKNTKDVLISSAYYSQVDAINGMVKRYHDAVNYPFRIIVTGGNLDLIKKDFDFKYEVVDNLCLLGIKIIANNRK